MKTFTFLTLTTIFIATFNGQAQLSTNRFLGSIEDFADNYQITLRESAIDKNALDRPARIQYVGNQGGDDSYAIDVGLSASLVPNTSTYADRFFFGPTIEYHKQTETKKKQENFQSGLTAILKFGDPAALEVTHFLQLSTKYKHDHSKTDKGFIGKIDYAPVYAPLLIGRAEGWDWMHFMWQPSIGIQHEYGDQVSSLVSTNSGNEFRLKAGLEFAIYPFAVELRHQLEIATSYTYWRSLEESGEFNNISDDRKLFRVAATYYFDEKSHFGLSLEYRKGEDPEVGLDKQENIIVSFVVKF